MFISKLTPLAAGRSPYVTTAASSTAAWILFLQDCLMTWQLASTRASISRDAKRECRRWKWQSFYNPTSLTSVFYSLEVSCQIESTLQGQNYTGCEYQHMGSLGNILATTMLLPSFLVITPLSVS